MMPLEMIRPCSASPVATGAVLVIAQLLRELSYGLRLCGNGILQLRNPGFGASVRTEGERLYEAFESERGSVQYSGR